MPYKKSAISSAQIVSAAMRVMARQGYAPDEILRQLNDELLDQNPRGMFVTLQVLVFDPVRRLVTCASAGHHAAIRLRDGEAPEPVFTSSDRVLDNFHGLNMTTGKGIS